MHVPPSHTARCAVAFVALLLTVPCVAHAGTTTVPSHAGSGSVATGPLPLAQPDDSGTRNEYCTAAEPVRFVDDPAGYDYVDGLAGQSRANWTDGETLRIGAVGDCSLGVAGNATATLTAATIDPDRGRVTGVVDVGRDGALRFVRRPGNDTAAVAIENVGRENSARLAVVATNDTGATTSRAEFPVPSGRFVAVDVRWYQNDTAHVWLWDTDRPRPDRPTTAVDTAGGNAAWRVQLDGRVYLDEIAIGSATPAAGTAGKATATGTDDTFDFDEIPESEPEPDSPERSDDTAAGLLYGPLLAIFGVISYRYAYALSKFGEQLDAIGSTTRSSQVEPADWNVLLTKLTGAGAAVFGVGWLLASVL